MFVQKKKTFSADRKRDVSLSKLHRQKTDCARALIEFNVRRDFAKALSQISDQATEVRVNSMFFFNIKDYSNPDFLLNSNEYITYAIYIEAKIYKKIFFSHTFS